MGLHLPEKTQTHAPVSSFQLLRVKVAAEIGDGAVDVETGPRALTGETVRLNSTVREITRERRAANT
jgi:hypothetical protein